MRSEAGQDVDDLLRGDVVLLCRVDAEGLSGVFECEARPFAGAVCSAVESADEKTCPSLRTTCSEV